MRLPVAVAPAIITQEYLGSEPTPPEEPTSHSVTHYYSPQKFGGDTGIYNAPLAFSSVGA